MVKEGAAPDHDVKGVVILVSVFGVVECARYDLVLLCVEELVVLVGGEQGNGVSPTMRSAIGAVIGAEERGQLPEAAVSPDRGGLYGGCSPDAHLRRRQAAIS